MNVSSRNEGKSFLRIFLALDQSGNPKFWILVKMEDFDEEFQSKFCH